MRTQRNVFVTNEPTCSASGLPVNNCRCGGHGQFNQFNRPGDVDGADTLYVPQPTMNYEQEADGMEDRHVLHDPRLLARDTLPLPDTTGMILNAQRRAERQRAEGR